MVLVEDKNTVELCVDVLVEILSLCTGKDLYRFKCVSKGWYNLISHVCIPGLYQIRDGEGQSQQQRILAYGLYFKCLAFSDHLPGTLYQKVKSGKIAISDDKIVVEYVSLLDNTSSTKHMHPGCKLIDSCNGLLLFENNMTYQYYVCNPLVKQCVQIPKSIDHQSSCVWSALAFDPSESIHYKIVRFTRFESELLIQLDIYSSEAGQWIRRFVQLDSCVTVDHSMWTVNSVYFNGVMYRLSRCRCVLCLDLNAMSGHVISIPRVKGSRSMGCIGVWKGRLSLAKCDGEYVTCIWALEDHCETGFEWVLKYSFSCYEIVMDMVLNMRPPHGRILPWFEPRAFCPNSNVIVFGATDMILSYDFISHRFEELFRTKDDVMCYGPYLLDAHCLVSPINDQIICK